MRSALLCLAVLACLGLVGCGGSDDGGSTAGSETTASDAGGCTSVAAPAAREDGTEQAPTERLDPERTYRLELQTNCGTFTVTLDQTQSPATAASLVTLARAGFFDHTIFHRIVPGFVIQGGDPTQAGSGGPGYQTRDVPPSDAAYVKGVVAMAKSQAEPSGTSGSQFFVVTGADVGLPPDYAIVGRVTSGIAVVDAIGKLGDPATEEPTQPVVVDKMTVVEQ